jgi:thioredoxin 1
MEINSQEFDKKVLQSNKPVVVEVYTNSCPHCQQLHPIFEKTAQENNAQFDFYKLNAVKNLDIAKKYKILGVPSLFYFVHGKLVDKKTGVLSQKRILKRLEPLLDYTPEMATKKEVTGYIKLPWK